MVQENCTERQKIRISGKKQNFREFLSLPEIVYNLKNNKNKNFNYGNGRFD